ncbi:MAG TPA: hypothetical protein VNJ31_12380 [Methyloceanibacter sp.]|nr:hypothetical protein [Methyloceanibacter sp.]
MLKRGLLVALLATMGWTAQAQHAIAPEAELLYVGTREMCTTIAWGLDGVRTDCRYRAIAADKPTEALKGICTTFYGRRTCY